MNRSSPTTGAGDRFASLSPAARALLARQAGGRDAGIDADASRGEVDSGAAPLSFAQRRVWFFEQRTPGTATYNRPKRITLTGALDVTALRRAFRELFRRHEVLRSAIDVSADGVPTQRVLPLAPADGAADYLAMLDLSGDPDAEHRARAVAAAEAVRPFDLSTGPLARATLVRLSAERHVLLFTASHLAFDGWSTGILCRELGTLYRAFATGQAPALPELPWQYRDHAAREAAYWTAARVAPEIAYWTEALRGAPPVVRLPREAIHLDVHDGAATSDVAAVPSLLLPPALVEALKRIGRSADATLFMTLLAAFGALLARLAGQDDLVVGVPVAGRLQPESEPLVGFFANTLPVRLRFSAGLSFRALLADVRANTRAALAHQALPFDLLVEQLKPERSAEHAPLVQTLFNFRNFAAPPLDMGDVTPRLEHAMTGASPLELGFDLEEQPDGALQCVAEYDQARFSTATVTRWLSHYRCMLEAIAADPDAEVARLPLLTPAERRHILMEWNAPGPSSSSSLYGDGVTLHGLVAQQVRRAPDAVAIASEGGEMTYAELARRATRLAHDLVARGVGPGVLVAVCLERSAELVIALLAVLEAGAAYLPLEPEYPRERLAFMLADSGARALVTTPALAERVCVEGDALPAAHAGASRETVYVDAEYWAQPAAPGAYEPLAVPCMPDDLAYVMYTSGSTGRPKGAMNTHRGVCNVVLTTRDLYGACDRDVVLHRTPVSFDPAMWEIFTALVNGARLVLARPGGHADPVYLVDLVATHHVTIVDAVPTVLQAMLEVPGVETRCATLRVVVCGGDVLTRALQDRILTMLPAALHNAYGPTEAAINATDWPCKRDDAHRVVPLGRPLPNVRIYILDAYGEPVPIGVAGELHIGGVAVGRGYLGRPELTAERFVADPFSPVAGARMYRTGDLARYDAAGVIEYVGRRDHQVKLHGVRIELGEIESALRSHPDVRETAALLHGHSTDEPRLVAYVVASHGAPPSERDLRTHLQGRLPRPMIPSAFVVLDALPLTPNGKLDRAALPAPVWRTSDPASSAYVAPRTPTEAALAQVWAELLGCERVSVHDNFFELGGHSLLAMRMVSRALASGLTLAVGAVFEAPTVAELAALVDGESRASVRNQPEIKRLSRAAFRRPASTTDGGCSAS